MIMAFQIFFVPALISFSLWSNSSDSSDDIYFAVATIMSVIQALFVLVMVFGTSVHAEAAWKKAVAKWSMIFVRWGNCIVFTVLHAILFIALLSSGQYSDTRFKFWFLAMFLG